MIDSLLEKRTDILQKDFETQDLKGSILEYQLIDTVKQQDDSIFFIRKSTKIQCYNLKTKKKKTLLTIPQKIYSYNIKYNYLIIATSFRNLYLYKYPDMKLLYESTEDTFINYIDISENIDHHMFIYSTNSRKLYFQVIKNDEITLKHYHKHSDSINCIATNKDNSLVAIASDNSFLIIFNNEKEIKKKCEINTHLPYLTHASFNSDSTKIACVGDHWLLVYSIADKSLIYEVHGYKDFMNICKFSPTYENCLIYTKESNLYIVNLDPFKPVYDISPHKDIINCGIQFSSDGKKIFQLTNEKFYVYDVLEHVFTASIYQKKLYTLKSHNVNFHFL